MNNALELHNVCKTYKGFTLQDISFSLPKGYIMGLVGPNGAGKTTIIKLIMNLIRRDAGSIAVFGKSNIDEEAYAKSRIGFVYDEPTFCEDVKLRDLKSAYCLFYEQWDEGQFQSLAQDFELPLQKKYKTLSQGMKIKFALALALSHGADLIVMDEPTAGLDPVFRRKLLDRLTAVLQNEGKSILFSTHITSDLDRIADYVTFIRDGKIVFSTTKDALRDGWAIVRGGPEILNNGSKHLLRGYRQGRFGVEALVCDIKQARRTLPDDVVVERATLEDIMYFMTKGGLSAE